MTNLKQQQQQQEQEYKVIDFNNFVNKVSTEYKEFKNYYMNSLDYNKEELAEAHADAVVDNFNKLSNEDRFKYVNTHIHFYDFLRKWDYVITYYSSGEFGFSHIADYDYEETDAIDLLKNIQYCIRSNNVKLSKELCKELSQIFDKYIDEDGAYIYSKKRMQEDFSKIVSMILEYK